MEVDPAMDKMEDLVNNAHIHVLPSFNNTGIKIKLLNALFNGKHCLVNNVADNGSGLESLSHHAETTSEFINMIQSLVISPYQEKEKMERTKVLSREYNNDTNAATLISWIY